MPKLNKAWSDARYATLTITVDYLRKHYQEGKEETEIPELYVSTPCHFLFLITLDRE